MSRSQFDPGNNTTPTFIRRTLYHSGSMLRPGGKHTHRPVRFIVREPKAALPLEPPGKVHDEAQKGKQDEATDKQRKDLEVKYRINEGVGHAHDAE